MDHRQSRFNILNRFSDNIYKNINDALFLSVNNLITCCFNSNSDFNGHGVMRFDEKEEDKKSFTFN